ncbi:Uncharacterised protein [Pseudomonas aeruginosa]|nr:Uncharacterised protein [Pseudomonas aeruginosa]
MADGEQFADVAEQQHAAEQVDEGDDAEDAGDPPDDVDDAVAEHRHQDDEGGEDEDPGAVAESGHLADRLPGKYRAGSGEAQVHQAYQGDRDAGAVDTELHPAGNHLRQPQPRPLRGVQGHHGATEDLPEEQADQRPEHIAAEHHGEGAGDDGGDLQVGPQPEGELAVEATVALVRRDIVDRAPFDQRLAVAALGHAAVLRCGSLAAILVVARTGQ